jgi:hypothetical protein
VKNFIDFLGRGFSGDVEGRRAKMQQFEMAGFSFNNPIVAFPDMNSIKNVKMVPDRMGSVGAEIMRRFTVVFDYQKRQMFLKKNNDFNSHFTYNKSGVEIQHNGLQWVQETVKLETVPEKFGAIKITNDFKYKFQLKPIYDIAYIRNNSPAANSGLQKGDIIITINRNPAYKYTLQEIYSFFKSEEEKWITLEVERNNEILKFSFQLNNVL